MGQHPHTPYISSNTKNALKGDEIPGSLLRLALRLRQPVKVPKKVKPYQGSPKLGQGSTGALTLLRIFLVVWLDDPIFGGAIMELDDFTGWLSIGSHYSLVTLTLLCMFF
jgi:hypothetical protein